MFYKFPLFQVVEAEKQQEQQQQREHRDRPHPHSHTGTPSHRPHTNGDGIYDNNGHADSSTPDSNRSPAHGISTSSSLPELQNKVTHLSDRVLREQRRRRSLEQAVKRLTEENRRLQDESQAAVQQLKRFTEWFFQTIGQPQQQQQQSQQGSNGGSHQSQSPQ